jgi:hypothetical protein
VDWSLCLTRSAAEVEPRAITLGHPLLDDYLAFVGARARPNTWLACAYDLKVFFGVVAKEPAEVTTADVFGFIKAQRAPRRGPKVVRLEDGEAAWPPAPSSGGWPACRDCSTTWSPSATPGWRPTRCRGGRWRAARPRRRPGGARR